MPASKRSTHVFGHRLVSTALALRELPCGAPDHSGSAVVVLAAPAPDESLLQWLHEWTDTADVVTIRLARLGKAYFLRFPGLCDFTLDVTANRVEVHAAPDLDADTLEHLLVDQVLPRFLAQEGQLVSHASAVTDGVSTALFMGKSGWGKSTLASQLCRLGMTLLSDDCVVLSAEPAGIIALPTYRSLRLNPDSIENTLSPGSPTAPVASYTDKRRLPATGTPPDASALRVTAIYLLADPSEAATETTITRPSPADSCMRIIGHAFQLDFTDRQASARLLGQASHVARSVPCHLLAYPRDFEQAEAVARMVITHLRGEAT